MSSISLIYIVIERCVPDMMVKIEGLDCLLPSIRRRVKHVKEGLFQLFDKTRLYKPARLGLGFT